MYSSEEFFQKNLADFEKGIVQIQKQLLSNIKFTMGDLNLKNGKFLNASDDIKEAILQLNNIDEALEQSGYYKFIQDEILKQKEYFKIRSGEIQKQFKSLGGFDANAVDGFLQAEFITLQDVGTSAANAVKQTLLQSVTTGLDFDEAVNLIASKLDTNLTRYAETWYRTAFNEYTQKVEDNLAEAIGFGDDEDDIWEYMGAPLQDNSHEECIWALTEKDHCPFFTNEEKEAFETGTAYPGQPSPPRYNCQHKFNITNMTYEEYKKQ